MYARERYLTRVVKSYSPDLFVKQTMGGILNLMRRASRMDTFEWNGVVYAYSKPVDQFIMSFTEDWQEGSKPVDWGVEPLLERIQEIDSWRDDTGYQRFCERRERNERIKKQTLRNELRARAADMRVDFAKATNDLNLSSVDMLDPRRKQDGYSKS